MKLQSQIEKLIARQASDWIGTLRNGGFRERMAFVAWLKGSRLHVQEFLEMTAVDQELSRIDKERRQALDALPASDVADVVMLPTADRSPTAHERRTSRRMAWSGGIAATLVIGVTSVYLLLANAEPWQEHSTARGEQRRVELADGSTVHLNAQSKLQVRLGDRARDVRMERGEALFKVAPDANRPFRVHGHAVTVLAVGTAFNVYERPDGSTKVSVLEGRVRITARAEAQELTEVLSPSTTVAHLSAGEEAQIEEDGKVHRERTDVATAVAWRERLLVFEDTPLEEIVEEFNRYNARQIRIEGIPSDSHHYTGIFNADDPDSLAQLLARERDVLIVPTETAIVIRPRSVVADTPTAP